jgi:hypothetical protein
MLMQLTTGEENFPTGSSKCHAFFVPTRTRMGKEMHIAQMAKGVNPDVPVSATNVRWFNAMPGYPEGLGRWCQSNYDVPEGVVLKVFGTKTQKFQNQRLSPVRGAIYIQLRSGAAFQRLAFQTMQDPKGSLREAMIEGRFDILTPQEIGQLGISMDMTTMELLNQTKVDRLFHVSVLDKATQSKTLVKSKQVVNSDGKTVTVAKTSQRRAVNLT